MDQSIYPARHVIENTFARSKYFRGLAIRFDKLKNNYANPIALAWATTLSNLGMFNKLYIIMSQ